ncbi:hypothetical protein CPB84DRAFT_1816607 [Gymnopilus junonius]|uniref:SWIM-type domain-containing protein n=1 Tax=Gymnopilus junonius TaxID=109634 RepID=A0A9P5NI53_GYMJU|nr:hypothetical protein CPB84DRAFT_1816607 [Gymnopilus junonius]
MIASYGTEETIAYFLFLLQVANPFMIPWRFMSDRDLAQINAIVLRYPESLVWLCCGTFFMHGNNTLNQTLAPACFWDYFVKNWLQEKFILMWSAIYHRNREIHLLSDTNMLLEVWHHVLKGKFLEGQRNRRVDHLVYIPVMLNTGENLENQKCIQVITSSKTIKATDIEQKCIGNNFSNVLYSIKSSSRPEHWYEVDILAYTCSCPNYPSIKFCKHLCAVQTHYPSSDIASLNELDDLSYDSCEQLKALEKGGPPPVGLGIASEGLVNNSGTVDTDYEPALDILTSASESAVLHTRLDETRSLLPVKRKLSPRLNSWPETQAAMMPAKKTCTKQASDEAYSAGEASGKKAKKNPKGMPSSEPQVILQIAFHPPQAPPAQSQLSQSYYRPKTHLY